MARDIQDVLPTSDALEGVRTEKSSLEGKKLTITDFVPLNSAFEGKATFSVVQAVADGKKVTFSGGTVIDKKLDAIGKSNLPVAAKLVQVKAKKGGRAYWDLASTK